MKKNVWIITAAALLLCGCTSEETGTVKASENTAVDLGSVHIDKTEGDYRLYEYADVLSADGFWYADYVTGEAQTITGTDGKEAELYPSQVYVLVYEGTEPSDAAQKKAAWLEAAEENYLISSKEEKEENGISWTVVEYTFKEGSTFERGTSAIGTKDSIALILELTAAKDDTHDLNEARSWFTAHTAISE